MRIPDRLENVRLAIAKLEEAERLITAAHVSTKSLDDNLVYLREQETKLQDAMRAGTYECPLKPKEDKYINDLKYR